MGFLEGCVISRDAKAYWELDHWGPYILCFVVWAVSFSKSDTAEEAAGSDLYS